MSGIWPKSERYLGDRYGKCFALARPLLAHVFCMGELQPAGRFGLSLISLGN